MANKTANTKHLKISFESELVVVPNQQPDFESFEFLTTNEFHCYRQLDGNEDAWADIIYSVGWSGKTSPLAHMSCDIFIKKPTEQTREEVLCEVAQYLHDDLKEKIEAKGLIDANGNKFEMPEFRHSPADFEGPDTKKPVTKHS